MILSPGPSNCFNPWVHLEMSRLREIIKLFINTPKIVILSNLTSSIIMLRKS